MAVILRRIFSPILRRWCTSSSASTGANNSGDGYELTLNEATNIINDNEATEEIDPLTGDENVEGQTRLLNDDCDQSLPIEGRREEPQGACALLPNERDPRTTTTVKRKCFKSKSEVPMSSTEKEPLLDDSKRRSTFSSPSLMESRETREARKKAKEIAAKLNKEESNQRLNSWRKVGENNRKMSDEDQGYKPFTRTRSTGSPRKSAADGGARRYVPSEREGAACFTTNEEETKRRKQADEKETNSQTTFQGEEPKRRKSAAEEAAEAERERLQEEENRSRAKEEETDSVINIVSNREHRSNHEDELEK